MPFANQFALSLELTRLLPLSVIDNATQKLINYARELNGSGSDIVVEQDLVDIFGRSRISPSLASSFQTTVKMSSSSTQLWESITLRAGPGPTVERAFRESPYFSMVVQLSFLTWFFKSDSVATALSEAMQSRLKGAPPQMQSPPLSRESILGVLKACERQTAAYDWNKLKNALVMILQPSGSDHGDLYPEILTGALDIFPMVQTLPEDRLVCIQLPIEKQHDSALCPLVIWTHHILGLNVTVKKGRYRTTDYTFGEQSNVQVIIEEVDGQEEPFISLLDASEECLLKIEPDPEVEHTLVGSLNRIYAREWGEKFLLKDLVSFRYDQTDYPEILRELKVISCSFAQIIAAHLMREYPETGITVHTNPEKIKEAANIIFNSLDITQREIDDYNALYKHQSLDNLLPVPSTIRKAAQKRAINNAKLSHQWDLLCRQIRRLSVFLIAFTNIQNPEDCDELVFCGLGNDQIANHELAQQLAAWDGKSLLHVKDAAWLQAIAVLLLAHSEDVWSLPWERVCLVSDRGWSAWIPTFQIADPEYTNVGSVFIRRGSPCRNGVWKEGVWDLRSESQGFWNSITVEEAEEYGQYASLRCSKKVSFETPYCGEQGSVFLISARLKLMGQPRRKSMVRIGFRELHTALWRTQLTESCTHDVSYKNDEIRVPANSATVESFGAIFKTTDKKVLVSLTAKCSGARWCSVFCYVGFSTGVETCLLRRNSCCFECAMNQAQSKEHQSLLVL